MERWLPIKLEWFQSQP